ncbi:MAG: MoxR family ATPase [Ilumatobacter sp.]|uniref:AAA family ATPase n=1 Tax=Ilumatobacter sp. TaxID=1967498 RepID=UPI003C70F49B
MPDGSSTGAGTPSNGDLHQLVERLRREVVGRVREIELTVAAIASDRHIVIEGPPGTGKSTLLRAMARELGIGFEFVEGNAELTPARVVGHFDPARVLSDGYDPDVFVPGPLASALRDGSLLYIEELNRVPEETLNVLITVMSEREITVPRLGRLEAAPGFRLVAAMNPFDAVGTARISGAVYDRMCRIAVDYQSVSDETMIVRRAVGMADGSDHVSDDATASDRRDTSFDWLDLVVGLVRATRVHPDVRVGSSVRGAIDMVFVANSLAELRGVDAESPRASLDAALVALSGRIRVREGSGRTPEEIVTELWESIFRRSAADGEGGGDEGKAGAPTGATNSR